MKPSRKPIFDHVERTKAGGVGGFPYYFCPSDHLRCSSFLLQNRDSQEVWAPRLLEPSGLGTLWTLSVDKTRTDASQIIDFAFSFSLFYATTKGLGLPAADIKPENRRSIIRATFTFTVLYVSPLWNPAG